MAPEDFGPDDQEVRRLLAALSSSADPTPMPEQVAARLDGVLADMVAERTASRAATPAPVTAECDLPPVVDMADRRRRRRMPVILVAAASVAVVALGVTNVLNTGSGGASDSTASAGSAASTAGTQRKAPVGGDTLAAPGASSARTPGGAHVGLPRIHRASLDADVRRIAGSLPVNASGDELGHVSSPSRCELPPTARRDQVVAVRLDGRRATLVLRAPKGGAREAQVYPCHDSTTPVARTTTGVR